MRYAVVDVGSPAKGNLGWAVLGGDNERAGTDPHELIEALAEACAAGPLALGFEAPMYVPAKRDVSAVLKARPGEGNRAWCVAAGATTTAVGLAVVPWVLDNLAAKRPAARAWQDWTVRPTNPDEILVFEAFVTGGPSDGHIADARTAALAARSMLGLTAGATSALAPEHCLSVLGAAILHSGMSRDLDELKRNCLVIKALKTVSGNAVLAEIAL